MNDRGAATPGRREEYGWTVVNRDKRFPGECGFWTAGFNSIPSQYDASMIVFSSRKDARAFKLARHSKGDCVKRVKVVLL